MKKFNKNIIVFILSFLFIGFGFSINSTKSMIARCLQFLVNDLKTEGIHAFETFTADMNSNSTEYLRYHDPLVDLDSLRHRFLNTRLIQKDDMYVVKAEGDTLVEACARCSDALINNSADVIKSLQVTAEENGAEFLYIAAPTKNIVYTTPENVENYSTDNFNRYIKALRQRDVFTLDLHDEFRKADMLGLDTYFLTDHHWTPETGFWVANKICSTLHEQYGFEYNEYYTDINNYATQIHKDCFLGSTGKKVGKYYTPGGLDDLSIISPKFETSLTELQPLKETEKTGSFADVLLDTSKIYTANHFDSYSYTAYGGGDFRLQIIKNHLNTDGKKILIVRDSFAGVVTPYLSLNAAELHIIDVRDIIPTDPIDVYDYVEEISPDYVLVLYSGTEFPDESSGKFDFSTKD